MSAPVRTMANPTGSPPTQGRIPPRRVTEAYMEGLIDEACQRFRKCLDPRLTDEQAKAAENRYVETRTLITMERDRWLAQESGRGAEGDPHQPGHVPEEPGDRSNLADSGGDGNRVEGGR